MSESESKRLWQKVNVRKINKALDMMGGVRLYHFEKPDKDAFLDATIVLQKLIDKYKEKEDG